MRDLLEAGVPVAADGGSLQGPFDPMDPLTHWEQPGSVLRR